MYKPVILVILDGFGRGPENAANAIFKAKKPNFDFIEKNFLGTNLQASGIAVGLPWGEEGNSEVGHLNLGAGRIVYQYLPRIMFAIRDGSFFKNPELLASAEHVKKNNSAFHIIGLIGSGNVHSYIDHLYAALDFAKNENIKEVFIHAFTDGRDSPPKDALMFYEKLQNKILESYPFAKVSSLIGRHFALDRDNNWDRTEKAYKLLTENTGEVFSDIKSAIESDYGKHITDEFIEPKIIPSTSQRDGGPIKDGDAVLFLDFREDSARQLTRAFVEDDFNHFPRKKINDLYFATMTRYEKGLPINVLFEPLKIESTLAEVVSKADKSQVHIAETEKYAHVTYFFNGLVEPAFPKETRELVPSEKDYNFSKRPEMDAFKITEKIIEALKSNCDFVVANYANSDMVGHTGDFDAAVKAVEVLDSEIGKIIAEVLKNDAALVITSDHGNADEMINLLTGAPQTEHTGNPVPFYLVAKDLKQEKDPEEVEIGKLETGGILADVAPTILELMDIKQPSEMTGKSLLKILKLK